MTKTSTSFLLLTFFAWNILLAHPTGKVQGRIVDDAGEALPFAIVKLLAPADSSFVQGVYADDGGHFDFGTVNTGNYFVEVQYNSMQTYSGEVFPVLAGEAIHLTDIVLRSNAEALETVSITARKPMVTIQPNKTIFHVASSVNAIGSNAWELLRKTPGVSIDQGDRILLQGKNGVQVYIDGKPSALAGTELAALLRSMPATQIESIEVISHPSARYDAAGNAGIINIVLKKGQQEGHHGNIELGASIKENTRHSGSLSGNRRTQKFNAYGAMAVDQGAQASFMELHREQQGMVYDQSLDIVDDRVQVNGRAGMDIFLGEKVQLGVSGRGLWSQNEQLSHSLTEIRDRGRPELSGLLDAWTQNGQAHSNAAFNAYFQHEDQDKGTFWKADADYVRHNFSTESQQSNVYLDPVQFQVLQQHAFSTLAPTEIEMAAVKLDHERPLFKGILGMGGKIAQVRTRNDFQFYDQHEGGQAFNAEFSNEFDFTEQINALYGSWQGEFGQWNIQTGLRMEQSSSKGILLSAQESRQDTVQRQYLDFFPSAGLTWEANVSHSLRLNYSRRIDRPVYQNLNPFIHRLDELTYQQGNPFLQPQYTHGLELSHVLYGLVNTSVQYSRTTDLMTELADTIGGNRGYLTHVNLDQQEVFGFQLSAPFGIADWWEAFTNVGITHTRNQSDLGVQEKQIDLTQSSWNIYHQSTFHLPREFSLELAGFYQAPSIWGANFKIDAIGSLDLGIQKRLFDGKGSLKASVNDVFYSMQWSGTQEYGGLSFSGSGGWESRQFKLNFSYAFGKESSKSDSGRTSSLVNEQDRVGAS